MQLGSLTLQNSPAGSGIVEIIVRICVLTLDSGQIPAVTANRPWSNVMLHLIAVHPFARRLHASLLPLCIRSRLPAAPVAYWKRLIQDMYVELTKCDSNKIVVFSLILESHKF